MIERVNRTCLTLLYFITILPIAGCRDDDDYARGRADAAAQQQKKDAERIARAIEETLVHPNWNWSEVETYKFLLKVSEEGMKSLRKSLDMPDPAPGLSRDKNIAEIQKQVLWVSSNIVTWPFRDATKINQHELTRWVAKEIGVDPWLVDTQPTFILERAVCEKMWANIWDKLTPQQRTELLNKIDPGNKILDRATLLTMGGTAALATLATTVYFTGFAFYTTMSVTICTVAGWFGVTVPFAAYAGSSMAIALLSGPVGWALIAVGTAACVVSLGKANVQKTAAFVVQLHLLKVAALQEAGGTVPDVPKRPW